MTSPMDPAEASALIGAIYDCAVDPDRWPAVLETLRRRLGFHNAILSVQALPSGEIMRNDMTGVPEAYASRLPDHGADVIDLWGGPARIAALPFDEPALLSRVTGPAMLEHRYYREWAGPQGLIDAVGVAVARDAGMLASLGMGRHGDAGPVTDADLAVLRLFVPHLQRAVAISRVFSLQAVRLAAFRQVVDRLGTPAFFVDEGLALIHANDAGHAVLAAGGPLRVEGGCLRLGPGPLGGLLRHAVDRARRIDAGRGARGSGTPVLHADGHLSALHVLPLARPGQEAAGGAACALFLSDWRASPGAPDLAAAAFGLTPAEAQVLARIAAGLTIAQAAQALDLRPSTVRTHLLRLFAKTGTHRQVELVLLAASLRGPLTA